MRCRAALYGASRQASPLCLLCLQLAWQQGETVAAAWSATAELLLHPHAWVRMAAGRLLGLAFAEPKIGECDCCTKPHMWVRVAAGYLLGLSSAVCAQPCSAVQSGLCWLQTAAGLILPPFSTKFINQLTLNA